MSGGVDGWLSFAEPDATVHYDGRQWTGQDALRTLLSEELDLTRLRWVPERATVSASSDLGYTSGTWRLEPSAGTIEDTGTYLTVWRKQAGGTWKMSVDMSQG